MRRVASPSSPPPAGVAEPSSLDTTTTLSSLWSAGELPLPVLSEEFTLSVTWLRVEEFTEEAGLVALDVLRLRFADEPGGLPVFPVPPELA
ncbi:hypothetical protein [Sphaerisporangium corydalis]|uniref:Uncharacterized protein n=1 Tax=Sphaerisporangium corydalis TaxID=1441875 RepID=A0ABV9EGU4_9ACTN|nr:hypothetical protein [Sphaerisporangium corydalis]